MQHTLEAFNHVTIITGKLFSCQLVVHTRLSEWKKRDRATLSHWFSFEHGGENLHDSCLGRNLSLSDSNVLRAKLRLVWNKAKRAFYVCLVSHTQSWS